MTARRQLLWQALPLSSWALSLRMPALAALSGLPGPAAGTVVASTPGRTALVIGNQRYKQNPLRSAVNDARAMAGLLKQVGFSVDLRLDASQQQMTEAIDAFGQSMAGRDIGTSVFYYAGHAAQLDWRNYLLPVDAVVQTAAELRQRCVDLGLLLGHLGRHKGKTTLIILDACRDDPFGSRFRPAQKGMSQYDAPVGTLLAFATSPGKVALEPAGAAHGLYTEHLMRELALPGVQVEDALKRVRLSVRLASQGRQIPWESTSLESDVLLFPVAAASAAELERQLREELDTWGKIKDSKRLADWTGYLRRFPNGRFAEAAQARIRRLLAGVEVAARPAQRPAPGPLQLGKGLKVPAPLQASGNPNSAGTYAFRPVWTVGDQYVFQELDLFSKVVQKTYRISIQRVDTQGDRVHTADGSVMTLMGGSLNEAGRREYDVPIEINPTELQIGRKWASRYQQSGLVSGFGEYHFRVTAREKVLVPAGELSAFRIEGEGWFNSAASRNRATQLTRWVVPGINLAVRQELRHLGVLRQMVSARQAVWVL